MKREQICLSIDELLEQYGDMVYRVALQNMQNASDAEDIAQDVFVKIIQKKPSFDTVQHERAWILRVTMNTCKDKWKYYKIRRTLELKDNQATVKEEKNSGILYEVMKLPLKYRNVIYLFYYEEMSVAQISEILQKKEATILTWLRRARKRLKIQLEEGDVYEK